MVLSQEKGHRLIGGKFLAGGMRSAKSQDVKAFRVFIGPPPTFYFTGRKGLVTGLGSLKRVRERTLGRT